MTKEENEYIIKTLESKVEKLQEDLRNKRISIKNKKAKIKELEQQIEKMKCCQNCAENDKYDFYDDTWHDDVCGDCENQCNWKLKE